MFNNYSTFRWDNCNWCDNKGWWWNDYRTLKPWVYHNEDLWLLSISYDWVDWITIADKNLWATEVWNKWDEITQENNWLFYQRWNNYWFPMDESQYTRRTTRINARNYWPWNYFNSNWVFYATHYYRDTSWNTNLRWWWNDTIDNFMWRDATNFEDRRWPCPEWFHVPSWWLLHKLFMQLIKIYNKLNCTNYIPKQFKNYPFYREVDSHSYSMFPELNDYIKLPPSWWLNRNFDWHYFDTNNWNLWTSSCSDSTMTRWYYANKLVMWKNYAQLTNNHFRSNAYTVRPFKNEPVVPDETWEALYVL